MPPIAGPADEPRQTRFRSVHGASSADDLSAVRGALWWRAQGEKLLVPRPVLCMAFAQLTFRESLRDIEACLRAHSTKLYHLGIRGNVARNTLANANATRDWRIYGDFAQSIDRHRARLYAEEPLRHRFERDGLRARFDHHRSVPVGLSLGTVPIDQSRREAAHAARSARQYSIIYLHQRRQVPRRQRPRLVAAGARCLLRDGSGPTSTSSDWHRLHEAGSFFVTRAKSNFRAERRYSHCRGSSHRADLRPNGGAHGLLLAQRVSSLRCAASSSTIPKTGKRLVFLTNNFTCPP